jgi:hypothetical protein
VLEVRACRGEIDRAFFAVFESFFPLFVLAFILAGKPATSTKEGAAADSQTVRSSSAIVITADGTLVIAVNPDSNSISLIDAVGKIFLAEIVRLQN